MDINLSCLKMFPVEHCTHLIRQINGILLRNGDFYSAQRLEKLIPRESRSCSCSFMTSVHNLKHKSFYLY